MLLVGRLGALADWYHLIMQQMGIAGKVCNRYGWLWIEYLTSPVISAGTFSGASHGAEMCQIMVINYWAMLLMVVVVAAVGLSYPTTIGSHLYLTAVEGDKLFAVRVVTRALPWTSYEWL